MPVALYYPHTTIRDPRILKNALLLWDHVECITPAFGKRPHWFDDHRLNEATELIVRDHIPTTQERSEVHEDVAALVRQGIPEWFQIYPEGSRPYAIYADKLPDETWELLEDNALSTWRADGHGVVSEPLGLLIMSLLADACAGTQKQRVTDRADAYSKLNEFLGAAAGASRSTALRKHTLMIISTL